MLSEIFQHVNEVWGTTQKIRQKKSRSIFQTFHNIEFSNLFLNGCELYALWIICSLGNSVTLRNIMSDNCTFMIILRAARLTGNSASRRTGDKA